MMKIMTNKKLMLFKAKEIKEQKKFKEFAKMKK